VGDRREVYVALLGEGAAVQRPVAAEPIHPPQRTAGARSGVVVRLRIPAEDR
jgi:hypothetical protein